VFRSNYDQLHKHLEESTRNASNWHDPVIRLRGLPYGCQKKEIFHFFSGFFFSLSVFIVFNFLTFKTKVLILQMMVL